MRLFLLIANFIALVAVAGFARDVWVRPMADRAAIAAIFGPAFVLCCLNIAYVKATVPAPASGSRWRRFRKAWDESRDA